MVIIFSLKEEWALTKSSKSWIRTGKSRHKSDNIMRDLMSLKRHASNYFTLHRSGKPR